MVGPPAMVGRRPAKIPPAGTLGAPTMAGGPTRHHILYCILYWVYYWYVIGYIIGPIIGTPFPPTPSTRTPLTDAGDVLLYQFSQKYQQACNRTRMLSFIDEPTS